MASKRNVKKDISYLTYEVVSDCYTFMYLHPKKTKEKEKAVNIITEILQTQDELIIRINNVDTKEKKEVKQYFKKIYEDLLNKVDHSFTELSKLTK